MMAPLRHAAILQHDDLVDEFEGRQPMGYQHSRAIGGRRKEVAHERVSGGLVEIGGGFVEDNRGEVGQQRPRDRYPPAFSFGQSLTTLPDVRIQAVG